MSHHEAAQKQESHGDLHFGESSVWAAQADIPWVLRLVAPCLEWQCPRLLHACATVFTFLNSLGGQGPFGNSSGSPLQKWGLAVMAERPGVQGLVAWWRPRYLLGV